MRKGYSLRKLAVIGAVAVVFLGGCASTQPFLGFLATTGYVDQKMKTQQSANQQSLDKIQSDLSSLQADVKTFKDQTGQIKQITDEIEKTRSETQQLQQLASTVEDRIASLPRDTLLQLAELIQKNLSKDTTAASSATSSTSSSK